MVEKGGASGRFVKEQEVSLKCVLAPINKLVNHRLDIIYDFRSEEVLLEYVQEWISFSKSRRLPSAVYSANVACLEERRLQDFWERKENYCVRRWGILHPRAQGSRVSTFGCACHGPASFGVHCGKSFGFWRIQQAIELRNNCSIFLCTCYRILDNIVKLNT